MAYRKRVTDGHRISVENYTGADSHVVRNLGALWQRAACSCGWNTGDGWKPHSEVTQLVATHGDPS